MRVALGTIEVHTASFVTQSAMALNARATLDGRVIFEKTPDPMNP